MLSLIFAGIFWGTGGLTGNLLGREAGLHPFAVAAYRLFAGGLLLLVVLCFRRNVRIPRGWVVWRRIVLIGVLSAAFQACFFAAISFTSVSVATLVSIGACPVIVLVTESIVARRLSRRSVFVVVLALAGFTLLAGAPVFAGSPSAGVSVANGRMLIGVLLALGAAAGFAAVTLVSARPVSGLDDLATVGFGFTLGGVLLLGVAAATSGIGFEPRVGTIGLLAVLATVPTAAAYTLYFRGLRVAAASTAALMALLEPLTGTVLAVIVLGERLSMIGIAGAVMLTGAVSAAART